MKKRGKSSYLTVVHFLQIVASQNSALFDMKILSRGHASGSKAYGPGYLFKTDFNELRTAKRINFAAKETNFNRYTVYSLNQG